MNLLQQNKSYITKKPFFIVVVYKEASDQDGFVITAFLTNKTGYLNKKEIIWKQKN